MTEREYEVIFQNISRKRMTFEDVFQEIVSFMEKEPIGRYKLMIGTDSQVFSTYTRFITGIVIQREGHGAWACLRKHIHPTPIHNLHQKISIETSLTEEIAYLFTEEKKNELIEMILPHVYEGATFKIEGHIDIGINKENKTREYVKEMVDRIEAVGMEAKIKPESIVASAYANRYTK